MVRLVGRHFEVFFYQENAPVEISIGLQRYLALAAEVKTVAELSDRVWAEARRRDHQPSEVPPGLDKPLPAQEAIAILLAYNIARARGEIITQITTP